jgi:hypothetical protein
MEVEAGLGCDPVATSVSAKEVAMPRTVVLERGTPAIRAMLIAVLVTALVIGAIALVVWAWPGADESSGTAGFGPYTPGDPPAMGDIHYTPSAPAGFGVYEPNAPPIMRDPQAGTIG